VFVQTGSLNPEFPLNTLIKSKLHPADKHYSFVTSAAVVLIDNGMVRSYSAEIGSVLPEA
jgi:hypothetical protein